MPSLEDRPTAKNGRTATAIAVLVVFMIGCSGAPLSSGATAVPGTTAPPTGAPGASVRPPGFAATAEVVIDGTPYPRSGGSCRAQQDGETYYWALTFTGPGDDYFSILLSADAPIADGSYTDADIISSLVIEGVADYNVRIDELNLRDNVSNGDFSGSADAGRIVITGTFDC